jgi:hypothetical protein
MMPFSRAPYVAVALLVISAGVSAQPQYDLAQYLMLDPGVWKLETRRAGRLGECAPRESLQGSIVTDLQVGGRVFRLKDWYSFGTHWKYDDTELYEILPGEVLYHGSADRIGWSEWELLDPPLRIPRALGVHQPVHYTGNVHSEKGVTRTIITLAIVADGLTRDTAAGRFTGCIKFSLAVLEGKSSWSEWSVLARRTGTVHWMGSGLEDDDPNPVYADSEENRILSWSQ